MRLLLISAYLTISIVSAAQPKWTSLDRLGRGDTLKLFAKYTDCGEWGGHHEYLLIYRESNLILRYSRDSVQCSEPNVFRTKLPDIVKSLDNTSRRAIEEYILLVDRLSREPQRTGSNAINGFYVLVGDKEVRYLDSFDWDEFDKLTKKILQ
jgi:hypothetical protein